LYTTTYGSEVRGQAGNAFTVTDPKALYIAWEKCRKNRILWALCDLRGERLQELKLLGIREELPLTMP
jgi:hypothetical protein